MTKRKILFIIPIIVIIMAFKNSDKKTIYSIGDSTMYNASTENNYPGRGWMQMINIFFNDQTVINNLAASGRSSKSYRDEGLWNKAITRIKADDYVFIQFGHNDEKPDSLRHTDPQTSFKENIKNYVSEVLSKGAHPILFTSIARRTFDSNGKLKDTHSEYVSVIRDLAKEMNIPLVDLNKTTTQMIEKYGPEESKKLFLYVQPGVTSKLPDGKKDDTHLCEFGATKVAELAVEGLKEINSPLVKNLLK
ncbi:rhamnogalacturonan acetylesterase [Pedobacter psychrophilus]|uniref:Rhamnogalacturonan acetylesterase n=1 Tax=Pedobacter psychrophilus TaxID=1826909 RepID=A0A179DAS3_9SPHI|nr:rhamnogalacturonan acetylesterase [Pedobacter psychrophilus]OAQ38014.1 rhamnogalacturonan acetylesterase [Pedobacter psychrophilus]